jgi:hypothetical protein
MNGTSGFQEVRSSTSRPPSYRFATNNGSNSERCVVCLVYLVSLVGLTQPNTRDRPDSGLRMLAACFYALIQNQYVTPTGAR